MAKMNGQRTGSGPTAYVAFHLTQDPINGAESPALGAGNQHGCATVGVATFHEAQITSKANRTRVEYGRPADTLNGDPRINDVDARVGMVVRRLTPRECERLMGWPSDHTRYRADGSEIPDGPRYRMIGNGVVAPVAAWIGRRLRTALEAVS
jgi:DNA (cytosine-5)-methyltransferase 1